MGTVEVRFKSLKEHKLSIPRSDVIMFVKVFLTFFIALTLFEVNALPTNSEGRSPATGFEELLTDRSCVPKGGSGCNDARRCCDDPCCIHGADGSKCGPCWK